MENDLTKNKEFVMKLVEGLKFICEHPKINYKESREALKSMEWYIPYSQEVLKGNRLSENYRAFYNRPIQDYINDAVFFIAEYANGYSESLDNRFGYIWRLSIILENRINGLTEIGPSWNLDETVKLIEAAAKEGKDVFCIWGQQVLYSRDLESVYKFVEDHKKSWAAKPGENSAPAGPTVPEELVEDSSTLTDGGNGSFHL